MKVLWVIPVVVGALILGGCSGYKSAPTTQNNTPSKSNTPATQPISGAVVKINNMAFEPVSATIKVGETVTWENEDGVAHSIKADSFYSELLQKGQRFSFTFPSVGTYNYTCGIHPSMKGTVIIE
jgi:plastocyanin